MLFTVFLLSFFSSNAFSIDLLQTYTQALQHDASYQRQVQLYRAQQQRVPQARSALLPNLSITANQSWLNERIQRTDSPLNSNNQGNNPAAELDEKSSPEISGISFQGTSLNSRDNYTNQKAALNLSQTIFNRAQWASLKQAKSQAMESEFELHDTAQKISLETVNAYFSYLKASDSERVSNKELNAVKKHQLLTGERYKDDLGTLTDVYESKSRYELANVDLINAENNKRSALFKLEKLIGHRLDSIMGLSNEHVFEGVIPSDVNYWLTLAKQESYVIKLSNQRLKTAGLEIKRQRSGHWPTLQLRGTSSLEDTEFSAVSAENGTRRNELLLELNIPLFSGFGTRAKVKEAAYRQMAAKEAVREAIEGSELKVRTDFSEASSTYQRMITLAKAYADSSAALELREQGFLEGLSSNLDILDAYRDTYRAERNWLQARYDYMIAIFTLKRSSQTISEDDIKSISIHLTEKNKIIY